MFPISFRVWKFVDAIGLYQIIRQCSSETFLAFVSYKHSTKIDCQDIRGVWWVPYIGKTGNVLSLPEQHSTVKKRDHKGVLDTEIVSRVDAIYKSSNRMMLSDRQDATQLTSVEDQGDEDHALRFDSDEHEDERAEEVAWELHDR